MEVVLNAKCFGNVQKQTVCLARVLLRKRQIVLLDEASSRQVNCMKITCLRTV